MWSPLRWLRNTRKYSPVQFSFCVKYSRNIVSPHHHKHSDKAELEPQTQRSLPFKLAYMGAVSTNNILKSAGDTVYNSGPRNFRCDRQAIAVFMHGLYTFSLRLALSVFMVARTTWIKASSEALAQAHLCSLLSTSNNG